MSTVANITVKANDQASSVIDRVRAKMNGMLGGVGSQSAAMTSKMSGGAITAGLNVMGLALGFKEVYGKIMEASYEAKKFVVTGKRLGMPAVEIAKLSRYAEQAGMNVGTMGRAVLLLQKNANSGMKDTNESTGILVQKLGMSEAALAEVRKGGVGAFAKVREAMGDTMDEGEQMAVWQQLIGQRAFEMAEYLKKSPEEMREATENSISMSERVIQSLASGQKAYANFQAEISKLFGELADNWGWLFGAVGWILTALMSGVRLLRIVGVLIETIAAGLWSIVTMNFSHIEKAMKKLDSTFSEVTEDLKRDSDVLFGGGAKETKGGGKGTSAKTLRTMEEIVAYNKALKTYLEKQYSIGKSLTDNDDVKLYLLKEQSGQLQHQINLLMIKHKLEGTQTAEYLQFQEDKLKTDLEIERVQKAGYQTRRDQAAEEETLLREHAVAMNDLSANPNRFYSEGINSTIAARRKAEKASADYEATMDDQSATPEQVNKSKLAYLGARNGYEQAIAAAQQQQKPNALVDSMQAVGGGGRIGLNTSGISAAQLTELKAHSSLLSSIDAKMGALAGYRANNQTAFTASQQSRTQVATSAEDAARSKETTNQVLRNRDPATAARADQLVKRKEIESDRDNMNKGDFRKKYPNIAQNEDAARATRDARKGPEELKKERSRNWRPKNSTYGK